MGKASRIEGRGVCQRQSIRMGTPADVSIPAMSLLAAACGDSSSTKTTVAETAGAIQGDPDKIIVRTLGDPWRSTYAEGACVANPLPTVDLTKDA